MVVQLNEGTKPPSLRQRIRQARSLVKEYERVATFCPEYANADESALLARAAREFRDTEPETIQRWLRVADLVPEAQVLIVEERLSIKAVDFLVSLRPRRQRAVAEAVAHAPEAESAFAALKGYVEAFRASGRKKKSVGKGPRVRRTNKKPRSSAGPANTDARRAPDVPGAQMVEDAEVVAAAGEPTLPAIEDVQSGDGNVMSARKVMEPRVDADSKQETECGDNDGTSSEVAAAVNLKNHKARAVYMRGVLSAIAEGRAKTRDELLAVTGGTSRQLHRTLGILVESNRIEKTADGTYLTVKSAPVAEPFSLLDDRLAQRIGNAEPGERMTAAQLAKELAVRHRDVVRALRRLAEAGVVVKHGLARGTWYGSAEKPSGE